MTRMRTIPIALAALFVTGCATDPRHTASMIDVATASPECLAAMDAANAYREHTVRRMLEGAAWGLVPVVGLVVSVNADLEKRREKQRLNAGVEAACGTGPTSDLPPIGGVKP